ncbi:MAG: lytic transglycosylase domain-containing protein [Firmicutes bacterium]|nr:lytic transglycosylase domain-containing protein [Bacillota bacterium]
MLNRRKQRIKVKTKLKKHRQKLRRGRLSVVILLLVAVLAGVFCWQRLPYYIYPTKYFPLISAEAEQAAIDPYLVCAVAKVESNMQTDALSSAGAVGLMQIMPETGAWLAERGGYDFVEEQLYQPQYNLRLGCDYLRYLLEYWQWDIYKAVASYNAGQSKVAAWLADGVWDGTAANLADIPFAETRDYVQRVIKAYREYTELYANNLMSDLIIQ